MHFYNHVVITRRVFAERCVSFDELQLMFTANQTISFMVLLSYKLSYLATPHISLAAALFYDYYFFALPVHQQRDVFMLVYQLFNTIPYIEASDIPEAVCFYTSLKLCIKATNHRGFFDEV